MTSAGTIPSFGACCQSLSIPMSPYRLGQGSCAAVSRIENRSSASFRAPRSTMRSMTTVPDPHGFDHPAPRATTTHWPRIPRSTSLRRGGAAGVRGWRSTEAAFPRPDARERARSARPQTDRTASRDKITRMRGKTLNSAPGPERKHRRGRHVPADPADSPRRRAARPGARVAGRRRPRRCERVAAPVPPAGSRFPAALRGQAPDASVDAPSCSSASTRPRASASSTASSASRGPTCAQ